MKFPRTFIFSCICFCSILSGTASYAQDTKTQEKGKPVTEPKPQVVVTVNGVELTAQEAQQRANMHMQQMAGRVPPQQLQAMMPRISQQVVDEFIAQTLLADQAKAEKIEASKEDIQKTIKDIEGRIPKGKTLEEAMKAQGISLEQLKSNIRRDLSIRKLLDEKMPKDITVSDEEIAAFYKKNIDQMKKPESVQASHILIKVEDQNDADAKAAAKKKIDAIKKQLDEGADFAELAKEKSDCPSAKKGGDLGSFTRGQMVGPFEKAAFSQKIGVIGPVVETKFGYHIIKVTGHTDAKVAPLKEVSENIKRHLDSQKRAEAFNAYIETLKANAKIEFPEKPEVK